MPKKKAVGDKIIEDNGWCDTTFTVSKKYADNHYDIFGHTCIKCRKRTTAKAKLCCTKCEEDER